MSFCTLEKAIAHLGIVDIMDFIKDDEFNISNQISSLVEHTPQDLGRHLPISYFQEYMMKTAHNQTTTFRIDLHISSQNTNRRRIESSFEISEFLIRKRFDRGCIDCPVSSACHVYGYNEAHLVMCFAAKAMAYSATTVLPADVWAATKTLSPISSR